MSTIVTINASDQITNSRTDINTNFSNLNTDKIETSVIDTDTTLAANSDAKIPSQKAVKAYVDAGGNVNASTTTKGIVEEATAAEIASGSATGGTGARLFVNPSTLNAILFGGTGADGALSISSGTTTVDLGSAQFYVLNYTSVSITGTGKLAFSNPNTNGTVVIIRSQGDVTLTSSTAPMIDCSGLGAAGGAAASGSSNDGSDGVAFSVFKTNKAVAGTGGAVISAFSLSTFNFNQTIFSQKYPQVFLGAGGASGNASSTTATSGVGGRGGGCLIIECGGAWNFTTSNGISVAGATGGNASTPTGGGNRGCAGGGGGAGGFCLALYKTLTANSGTINKAGGTGGTGTQTGTGSAVQGGGGGGSATNAGTSGTVGASGNDAPGGTGGAGLSLVSSYV